MPYSILYIQLPNNAVTFLNNDVTVGSIVLPEDGVLILKPSVTIRLAEDSECSGKFDYSMNRWSYITCL